MTVRDRDLYIYRFLDFAAAMTAWFCFFVFRKRVELSSGFDFAVIWQDDRFYLGIIIIPICWLIFYYFFDKYQDIYRLSRIATIGRTFILSIVGVLIIFFILLRDDLTLLQINYTKSFSTLLFLHFGITIFFRMLWLTICSRRLRSGKVGYNTLLIGAGNSAQNVYSELSNQRGNTGHFFKGYIQTNGEANKELQGQLPFLGSKKDIKAVVEEQQIEEIIIATDHAEHDDVVPIVNELFEYRDKIKVSIIPDMYDILIGKVKLNHVLGAALIDIEQELMSRWQKMLKRVLDVTLSIIALVLLSPLILYTILRVRWSSAGPVIFTQERLGKHGVPFRILKFRSMAADSEESGPQLAYDGDHRVTQWGAIMRKWRIDEIPQFWNVIKGDMSVVGPRPERRFFVEKIMLKAPHYKHLLKVRPGITSWGQVKYGYASNIDEMIQRLKYDILYIENMSLTLDFKIMAYTISVLLQGKGK